MNVKVTLGVYEPEQVDVDRLMAEVPCPKINAVFGGQHHNDRGENPTVVATRAIEAFVPDPSQIERHLKPIARENILCIHQMKVMEKRCLSNPKLTISKTAALCC